MKLIHKKARLSRFNNLLSKQAISIMKQLVEFDCDRIHELKILNDTYHIISSNGNSPIELKIKEPKTIKQDFDILVGLNILNRRTRFDNNVYIITVNGIELIKLETAKIE